MPIYLVRRPGVSASLVSARDEEDLLDTLDQVADSEGCSWAVYRGPLWIDFDVPAKYRIDEKVPDEPLRPDDIVVEDVERVEIGAFGLSIPGCDHTSELTIHELRWIRDVSVNTLVPCCDARTGPDPEIPCTQR